MTIGDRNALRRAAGQRLQSASYDPKRLVLIHSGVSFGVALLIALLNHLIYQQVNAHTGGLAGMELRSVLETAATALQYVQLIGMPFWSVGLVHVVLQIARQQQVHPGSLLEGFRRFGPVLRLFLLEFLLYMAIAFTCAWVGSILFVLTPFAASLAQLLDPMLQAQTPEQMEAMLAQLSEQQLMSAMLPAMILIGILCLVVMVPLSYRLRFAQFVIMDQPGTGALAALTGSARLLRGNCMALFKLDLQFWFYYLLSALVSLLAYADQLLPLVGITLPVSDTAAYFGSYVLYVIASLALHLWMLPQVQTTYAVAYDAMTEGEQEHV